MSIKDELEIYKKKVEELEKWCKELGTNFSKLVLSEVEKLANLLTQNATHFGCYSAICIDTKDKRCKGRVRFFSPFFNKINTQVKQLDWAYPVSAMGGFDDCGCVWVPPAGSLLIIVFENGNKDIPYYLGTTWSTDRGPDVATGEVITLPSGNTYTVSGGANSTGGHNWNYPVDEYETLYSGHRAGYFIGKNDGSQDLPQWNTDNYQDIDDGWVTTLEIQQTGNPIPPNQYGFKTPQKHMLKFVDGYKLNDYQGKRVELMSSLGNWILLKDDYLNPETWASPLADRPSLHGNNPYFKHKNESWPTSGPGTPQNNRSALYNTGIQIETRSGHAIIMDDRVNGRPSEVPEWETCLSNNVFDFTDLYLGKLKLISTTGHRIELSDKEDLPGNRGPENYIRLLSACGNVIELNDHTYNIGTEEEPIYLAGQKRGITMQSTSRHRLEMIDYLNPQGSPERMELGKPDDEGNEEADWDGRAINNAAAAFVRLSSGYGLQIELNDSTSQQATNEQFIRIYCPRKTCYDNCGPHFMIFQELCNDAYVWLRVAGTYFCETCRDHITFVGDQDQPPSDWMTFITGDTLIDTQNYYLNFAELHYFNAVELILLLAGRDCWDEQAQQWVPCGPLPILMLDPNGQVIASDRVYGSASPHAFPISIFNLLPFPEISGES